MNFIFLKKAGGIIFTAQTEGRGKGTREDADKGCIFFKSDFDFKLPKKKFFEGFSEEKYWFDFSGMQDTAISTKLNLDKNYHTKGTE